MKGTTWNCRPAACHRVDSVIGSKGKHVVNKEKTCRMCVCVRPEQVDFTKKGFGKLTAQFAGCEFSENSQPLNHVLIYGSTKHE